MGWLNATGFHIQMKPDRHLAPLSPPWLRQQDWSETRIWVVFFLCSQIIVFCKQDWMERGPLRIIENFCLCGYIQPWEFTSYRSKYNDCISLKPLKAPSKITIISHYGTVELRSCAYAFIHIAELPELPINKVFMEAGFFSWFMQEVVMKMWSKLRVNWPWTSLSCAVMWKVYGNSLGVGRSQNKRMPEAEEPRGAYFRNTLLLPGHYHP